MIFRFGLCHRGEAVKQSWPRPNKHLNGVEGRGIYTQVFHEEDHCPRQRKLAVSRRNVRTTLIGGEKDKMLFCERS